MSDQAEFIDNTPEPDLTIVRKQEPPPSDYASLYKKMAQVMGAVGNVEKRGRGSDGQKDYTYVTDEDLYSAVRDAMSNAGLALIPRITSVEDSGKPVKVYIDFTFACSDTGATITIPWIGKSYNAPDKAISSAVTMAEKYVLKSTFLISTGDPAEDPDSPMNEAESVSDKGSIPDNGKNKTQRRIPPKPDGKVTVTHCKYLSNPKGGHYVVFDSEPRVTGNRDMLRAISDEWQLTVDNWQPQEANDAAIKLLEPIVLDYQTIFDRKGDVSQHKALEARPAATEPAPKDEAQS